MTRILIADDESSIRFVLREALEDQGYEVLEASDGDEARTLLSEQPPELAFLDIRMPGSTGFELLEEVTARGAGGPVIVIMTAQNTFENAIEAMKRGAFDYVTKPFDLAQVEAVAHKALRQRELRSEVASLRRKIGTVFRGSEELVGTSPAMVETFKTIGRIAGTEASVLIRGESGTGKELVARAIHYHSTRRDRPFVAVNMSAVPSELIEAELFGHEKGAFTGAIDARNGRFRESDGGTLLLDEIGDLPLPLQAKLLRVLQEREVTPVGGDHAIPVDVRILAATHQDLESAVGESQFREDLYFRLNVVPLPLVPLRERISDLPELLHHFVERFSGELGVQQRWPSEEALALLSAHAWPGNVRELQNVVKRALVLSTGEVIDADDIRLATEPFRTSETDWSQLAYSEFLERVDSTNTDEEGGPYWEFVHRLERSIIGAAMGRAAGNQIQAARLLGINRNTLRKKIVELEIDLESNAG